MKRIFLTGLFASLIAVACFAQKPYKVVFYNFENLFDTIHDPGVLDEEFTPEGPKKWNSAKYTRKIGNLERVLFDIAAEDKDYPVVIGVSEIENRSILEDIASTRKLLPARYAICHYDSPDLRGVDVAFLYRPDVFKLEGSADPTVFHRVPDDAARALNLKRKFPSPSTDAILSLSLEILLLMAAFADAVPNGSNKVRKIEHNKKIAKFLNFCFFMIYLHF